jgi:hypothetical protein
VLDVPGRDCGGQSEKTTDEGLPRRSKTDSNLIREVPRPSTRFTARPSDSPALFIKA